MHHKLTQPSSQANIEFNNRPDATADIMLLMSSDMDTAGYVSSREARPGNGPYSDLYPDCPYKTDSYEAGLKEINDRVERTRKPAQEEKPGS